MCLGDPLRRDHAYADYAYYDNYVEGQGETVHRVNSTWVRV